MENVWEFDVIITASEFEAWYWSAALSSGIPPNTNILLKDGKGYSYIRITDEPFPRISAVCSGLR